MSHFCLLSDPQAYRPQDWDLLADEKGRAYWLDLFSRHFEIALDHAGQRYGRKAARSIAVARKAFAEQIEKLRKEPASLPGGELNIMELCRARERVLRENRLPDPFGNVKQRENDLAMGLYMQVVRKLHAMEPEEKWLHLIECVFAGNIFDLGAPETMHLADDPTDFLAAVENTRPRPWAVDDYDALGELLVTSPPTPWEKAVVFVDNAGSDFILGVMPLVREMALGGTQIVLAANELPSLNDITVYETVDVVRQLAIDDADLAALVEAGLFEVVSTGGDIPLIDLSNVSDELNESASDADLVILEGMGRSIESNYDVPFSVDCLRLALLKDSAVAERVGGELFDCVCKYTPAG